MPQVRFRGVDLQKVRTVSKELVDNLQQIVGCPRDYFTIEHVESTFVLDGEVTKGYPFVDVHWFDRGQDVQDKVATEITKCVQSIGYTDVDVIFRKLIKRDYYENGEHF